MHTAREVVVSNGTSPASNASAPLASYCTILQVMTMLGNGVSTGDTATDSTERGANRARSATAARWGQLPSRVVVPPWCCLGFHLSRELSQDVRWQLSVSIWLGSTVTKLG